MHNLVYLVLSKTTCSVFEIPVAFHKQIWLPICCPEILKITQIFVFPDWFRSHAVQAHQAGHFLHHGNSCLARFFLGDDLCQAMMDFLSAGVLSSELGGREYGENSNGKKGWLRCEVIVSWNSFNGESSDTAFFQGENDAE